MTGNEPAPAPAPRKPPGSPGARARADARADPPDAPMIRTTAPGWEAEVRAAVAAGHPFQVACHDDPMPRIRSLRDHLRGQGYPLPDPVREELRAACCNAHAEGVAWRTIGDALGTGDPSHARYYAGLRPPQTGGARFYRDRAGS